MFKTHQPEEKGNQMASALFRNPASVPRAAMEGIIQALHAR